MTAARRTTNQTVEIPLAGVFAVALRLEQMVLSARKASVTLRLRKGVCGSVRGTRLCRI